MSCEFSIKDTWLVLYASDSLLHVLFTFAMEFPVSIIVFDICSVEKTYPHTKNSLQMSVFFAVVSVYLFRNDISQVVDSISYDKK